MNIIDVGACVGKFTDYCLKTYGNAANIFLFEPHSSNYEFLCDKYKDNSSVRIYCKAVSGFEGNAKLYKKRYGTNPKGEEYDFAGNHGSSLNSGKNNVGDSVYDCVEVIKLSSFIEKELQHQKIDILKLDCEGDEYDIINDVLGSKLYENIDKIYYEDHVRKFPPVDVRVWMENPYRPVVSRHPFAERLMKKRDNAFYRLQHYRLFNRVLIYALRIDCRTVECSIMNDMLEAKLYEKIDEAHYEHHKMKFPAANVSTLLDVPYKPFLTGDPHTKTMIKARNNVLRQIQEMNLAGKFFIEKDFNWEILDEGYFSLNALLDALDSKLIEKMARIIRMMGLP